MSNYMILVIDAATCIVETCIESNRELADVQKLAENIAERCPVDYTVAVVPIAFWCGGEKA